MAFKVEAFVNEVSLSETYFDQEDFESAIKTLLKNLKQIESIESIDYKIIKSGLLAYHKFPDTKLFISRLNREINKELKDMFCFRLLDRGNATAWQEGKLHNSECDYIYNDERVTDTSMAELTERLLLDTNYAGLLVNFTPSHFDGRESVHVTKAECPEETLRCYINEGSFIDWLETNYDWKLLAYPEDADDPPMDENTVLVDSSLFLATHYDNHGRTVFKELATNRMYSVDNLHSGQAAHLEVWDKRGKHLGRANLQGRLDTNKRKAANDRRFN